MTDTFTFNSPDGETVEVEVEEMSALEQMRWASKAPNELIQRDPENVVPGPALIDFLIELVESQTILTEELLEDVEQDELNTIFTRTIEIAFNGLETSPDDDETFDFDDGSVDLDDWR